MDGLLDRVQELCTITEAQLAAARRLDYAQLDELNRRRGEIAFDLRISLQDSVPPDGDRIRIQQAVLELMRLEDRLLQVSNAVLSAVGAGADTQTYDRSGRVRRAG